MLSPGAPLPLTVWFHKMPVWVSLNGGENWIGSVVGVLLQMWYFSSLENYQGKGDDCAGKFNYFQATSNPKSQMRFFFDFLRALNGLLSLGNSSVGKRIRTDWESLKAFEKREA